MLYIFSYVAIRTGKLPNVLVNAVCAISLYEGIANFCMLCDHFIYGFAVALLYVVCTVFGSVGGRDNALPLGKFAAACVDTFMLFA